MYSLNPKEALSKPPIAISPEAPALAAAAPGPGGALLEKNWWVQKF